DSENDHDEGGEHEKQDPAGVAHLPPAEMTTDPTGRNLSEEGRPMPCDGKSNDKGKIKKLRRESLKPSCEESPVNHAQNQAEREQEPADAPEQVKMMQHVAIAAPDQRPDLGSLGPPCLRELRFAHNP